MSGKCTGCSPGSEIPNVAGRSEIGKKNCRVMKYNGWSQQKRRCETGLKAEIYL